MTPPALPQPTRVAIACPGLGHVNRGFETFTRECFDALRADGRLDVRLYKGAGPAADRERAVRCLPRDGRAAQWLGRRSGRGAYYVEQATFSAGLLPRLARWRPRVVMFSDGVVGNALWHWRRRVGGGFKLLFSNGGPLGPPAFPRIDHVHQVVPTQYDLSAAAGRPEVTQTLIPYGFRIDPGYTPPTPAERAALRRRLGLPDGPVVLTVGAINHSHKRMDYLVREVSALPSPRPTLVALGQIEAETPAVREVAAALLPPDGFVCRTVPHDEVGAYYRAADVFALCSLHEGFGRVFVESQLAGLRCLAHDGPVQRFVLGPDGGYADLTTPGELARLLTAALAIPDDPARQLARHQAVADRFGWDRLAPQYVDMIERCGRDSDRPEVA